MSLSQAELAADPELSNLPPGVSLTSLENGLTIIVAEDHSAPVVSAQAWCMAGSIHEGNRLGAGMSHVLEHMLFKGTRSRQGSRIDQEVQEAGGQMNAYTSFDRTVFHIDVPNTGTRVALDVLCDIMQNATLPEDELEKEKEVIRREMDMNVDDPGRRASRRLFECAYTKSPCRYTVIGYPDIFNQLTRDDLVNYYAEKYAPNNVFYVVAGAVDSSEVVNQIKEAYASTKARSLAPPVLPAEPRQTAPRTVIEDAPIELGHFHVAWHIPDPRHPDVPALDLLAALLGNGRSSRLYTSVRQRQGLAHAIDTWTYTPGTASGMLGISGVADGQMFAAAKDAALAEVDLMKTTPVLAEELDKAIKQFVAATLCSRKTMAGQAQDLGSSWLMANDLNFSQRFLSAARKVTPDDIQRVARQYLTSENRTIYALLPTGHAPKVAWTRSVTVETPIQKFVLANGLRLLVKEDHRLPFVEMRSIFRGGVLAERSVNSGVTQLMGKMLLKGAGARSADEIARLIESTGGSIDSYGGNNTFGVNLEVLEADVDTGLGLLAEVLLSPQFPEQALAREREFQLASIRSIRDHPLQTAFQTMRRTMFGAQGYGLDAVGTTESVTRLSRDDVRAFHADHLRSGSCVFAVYGDIQTQTIVRKVEEAFSSLATGGNPGAQPDAPVSKAGELRRSVTTLEKQQAVVVTGFPGCSLQNPDRYALELLQEACSDLGSRLFLRVREQLGLAYYVGAQNFTGVVPGYFAFYAGTAPEHAARVEEELLKEAEALRTDGLTEAELKRAKAKIIGQRKISRQELGTLATVTALDELFGLGYDNFDAEDAKYMAVTEEQIRACASKYLVTQACVISIVTP